MKRWSMVALVAFFLATSIISAQDGFNLYGFLDVDADLHFIDDDNPMLLNSHDNSFMFRQGRLHKYFDYRPHDNMRVLTEVGFHWQPHGRFETGQRMVLNSQDVDVAQDPVEYENLLDLRESGRGETPATSVSLQRAWMEYNLSQYSNIRIGRFITPVGIWNVDHGSPVIVTAMQPYSTGFVEVFPTAQTGLMYYGRTYLDMYDLDYKIYVSSGRDVQPIDELADISIGGNVKFRAIDWGEGFEFGLSAYTGIDRAQSQWADMGLTMLVDPQGNPILDDANEPIFIPDGHVRLDTEMHQQTREHAFGVDAKFEFNNFLFQSEFNYNLLKNQLAGDEESSVFGTYFLCGYTFHIDPNFNLMPYALFEYIQANDLYEYDSSLPSNAVFYDGRQINQFHDYGLFSSGYADQAHGLILGVNANIFGRSNIKCQYTHINMNRDVNSSSDNDAMNFGVLSLQFTVAY